MQRRRLLAGGTAILIFAFGAGGTSTDARSVSPRPNIVFVLTDDLSNNLLRYMPHVLAMQRAGTSFSNYYVTDSLCCPSRASIFTGEFPHNTGVHGNVGVDGGVNAYNAHQDSLKSFAVTLQEAGYRTGLMGKYLNGYRAMMAPEDVWDEWDVAGDGYDEFDYVMRSNDTRQKYGDAPEDYLTDVISSKATDFIDSAADDAQPFMLEVAPFAPHAPYIAAPRYGKADAKAKIPRTRAYGAKPTNPPSWLAGLPRIDPSTQVQLDRNYLKRVRADLATDELVGRLQQELADKGLADNTYFVFSSDNGYHIGEYRLHAGKQTAFDTDISVPQVVTGPGVPADRVDTHLASSVDLAATFVEIADAPMSPTFDGVSLLGLWKGESPASWQQAVLIEHRPPTTSVGDPDAQPPASGKPPAYEAVRTASALYVQYGTGEIEYYDTSTDRFELHNLGTAAPESIVSTLAALQVCHGASECQLAAQLP